MKHFTPRDYQKRIVEHILDVPRCAVWAEMGLGKTVSVLTAVDALRLAGETRPVLVLAPKRVAVKTWVDEVRKWHHTQHLKCVPITGTAEQRLAAMRSHADIYTLNYENIEWFFDQIDNPKIFCMVVADESTKLKSYRARQGGKRTRILSKYVPHVERFVELSGTPSPNGLKDLWGQVWFLDFGKRLGRSFSGFMNKWFYTTDRNGYNHEPLPGADEQIQETLKDICISLRAEDYLEVGETFVNVIKVPLPPKAKELYTEMERHMYIELESMGDLHEIEAVHAGAKTQKCLQLASGIAYTDDKQSYEQVHTATLEALDEVIEEAAGAPIMIAYYYKADLKRLRKRYKNARVLDDKPETQDEWNRGEIPILLAHPASAGHGLNLQDGGNILVFFSVDWNLEYHDQIIERLGAVRQAQSGHDRPVFVHYIVAEGTVQTRVLQRLHTKASVQDVLMEAMKARKQ